MPKQGPDWFLVATKACGGGTPDLGFFLEVLGYISGVGVGNKAGGSPGCPRGRGPHPGGGGGGRAPPLVGSPGLSWPKSFTPGASFGPEKIIKKLARQLDSVCYSFSVKLKNKERTETGTGLYVNRLVPKII